MSLKQAQPSPVSGENKIKSYFCWLFQSPYFWPSQHHTPDNIEYAIFLYKRAQKNKKIHGLEPGLPVREKSPPSSLYFTIPGVFTTAELELSLIFRLLYGYIKWFLYFKCWIFLFCICWVKRIHKTYTLLSLFPWIIGLCEGRRRALQTNWYSDTCLLFKLTLFPGLWNRCPGSSEKNPGQQMGFCDNASRGTGTSHP